MADAEEIWPEIVRKHGLRDLPVEKLASWWHTDADLGRTIETFTDMGRQQEARLRRRARHRDVVHSLFERLRAGEDRP